MQKSRMVRNMHMLSTRRFAAASTAVLLAGSAALLAASSADAASTGSAALASAAQAKPAAAAKVVEPKGRVVSRTSLLIRQKPTTQSKQLGSFPSGAVIALHCKKVGQNVDGNKLWYLLGNGKPGWVSARYVQNLSPVAYCK